MDIDDDIIGDEFMPPAPTQISISMVDTELPDLFGYDAHDIREDRDLSALDGRIGMSAQELYYSIPGCARNRGRGPAWRSRDALRTHIDLYCIGEVQGQPSADWLLHQRLQGCRVCGKTLSIRFASGVHAQCWPGLRTADDTSPPLPRRRTPFLSRYIHYPHLYQGSSSC